MSTRKKVESLDIFDTQEVVFHIWDVYFEKLIGEFGKEKVMDEEEHTLFAESHNGAAILLWYRTPGNINHSCMAITHSSFWIAVIGTDHFFVSYAGDRQEIADWLVDWKLQM